MRETWDMADPKVKPSTKVSRHPSFNMAPSGREPNQAPWHNDLGADAPTPTYILPSPVLRQVETRQQAQAVTATPIPTSGCDGRPLLRNDA